MFRTPTRVGKAGCVAAWGVTIFCALISLLAVFGPNCYGDSAHGRCDPENGISHALRVGALCAIGVSVASLLVAVYLMWRDVALNEETSDR